MTTEQGQLRGQMICTDARCSTFGGAPHLYPCFAVIAMKFLVILKKGGLTFILCTGSSKLHSQSCNGRRGIEDSDYRQLFQEILRKRGQKNEVKGRRGVKGKFLNLRWWLSSPVFPKQQQRVRADQVQLSLLQDVPHVVLAEFTVGFIDLSFPGSLPLFFQWVGFFMQEGSKSL